MNTLRYYLFIGSGLLALIFTFFIDAITAIGIFNEFKLICKIKWSDTSYWKWYEFVYVISYYLIRFGIIIALLTTHSKKIILSVLLLLLISLLSGIWFYMNDYHPVWETYIPYLLAIISWLYLGLTMKAEYNQ